MRTLNRDDAPIDLVEIGTATCLELLAEGSRATVVMDGGARCEQVRYALHHGRILFQARCPTDHLLVAAPGAPVTFTVSAVDGGEESWTVEVRGWVELATDLPLTLAADKTEGQWLRIVPSQIEGRGTIPAAEELR